MIIETEEIRRRGEGRGKGSEESMRVDTKEESLYILSLVMDELISHIQADVPWCVLCRQCCELIVYESTKRWSYGGILLKVEVLSEVEVEVYALQVLLL